MGRSVRAHDASAVNGEQDGEFLHSDVVNQLVVGALQKGRINGDHRLQALAGEAGGEGHRLLFGDAMSKYLSG